jgi:glycerol-3-phosphate O-acyltransferase/dihydroxyacetone phosphate acyltransferase
MNVVRLPASLSGVAIDAVTGAGVTHPTSGCFLTNDRWLELQQRIIEYRRELRDLGIRDYQVFTLNREKTEDIDGDAVLREMQLPYQIIHLLGLLLLAAIPVLFLNLPVRILADLYSERRRKKALAHSKVKVQGYDVMMTEKILFCIVMVPTLWIFYGFLLYYFTNLDGPSIALAFLCMPLFAYMGIIVSEAGMVDWKDVRPYFMRLLPSVRRRLAALPATRRRLQADLRAFIKKLGPALGEIYYGKDLDWKAIIEKSRVLSTADLQAVGADPNSTRSLKVKGS